MALHSHDVPSFKFKMWNTWTVEEKSSLAHMIDWVAFVAKTAPGGKLKNVVINCHGFYGIGSDTPLICTKNGKIGTGGFGLAIGAGITGHDCEKFTPWKGLVDHIWITACGVARITTSGAIGQGDGNLFCSALAKSSGAYVYTPVVMQQGVLFLPFGYIDDYEGLLLRYEPKNGSVDYSKVYPNNGIPC